MKMWPKHAVLIPKIGSTKSSDYQMLHHKNYSSRGSLALQINYQMMSWRKYLIPF
uniref:Uncharacterized protein n=1 Tax=Arundo donax TaxID=35708 RepID=A0A0A9HUD7_ARUDO